MPLVIACLSVVIVLNIILGAIVLAKTYHKAYGWFFAATVFGVAVWAIGDLLLLFANSSRLVHVGAELFYIGPMIIPVAILFFSISFLDKKLPNNWLILGSTIGLAVWAILLIQNLSFLVSSISIENPYNVVRPNIGPFLLYASHFSVFFMATYLVLFNRLHKVHGVKHTQLTYTFFGVLLASIPALFSNLVLPLMGITNLIWLGPVFTLIFIILVSLAIIRHRLFDIRAAVVRSVAYTLSLATLVGIYVITAHFIADIVHSDLLRNNQTTVGATLALVLALLYQPFKRFFDKLSNKLFYRDTYSPEKLLTDLNNVLINNADLKELLRASSRVIGGTMKTEFCAFGVQNSETKDPIIIGTSTRQFPKKDIEVVAKLAPQQNQKVIISENLEDKVLRKVLINNDIAVIVRLIDALESGAQGIGYIALGQKKSGAAYSRQDVQVLEILADTTAIAIKNAFQFEEIQSFNTTLKQKVDDATSQLKRSNKKLQQLDATKDEFISMASHQLRTPLTSVKGYLSMVLDGDAGSITKDQRRFLTQAYVSSQRMVYTIADLLNVSRLQTGKFIIERSPVTITQIVEEEIEPLRETAKLKNITLTYEASAFCPPLMLDETKTRQVIMNFIDNAIYYTPNNGHINVAIEATAKMLELRVTDDGIGVPKADQPHMFTKFYRASNAQKVRPDGTGLGLFMAKKVIIAQGGSLLFKSTHGKGSTFGFSFPLVHE